MAKKIISRSGLFGNINHYDEKGRKIGSSQVGSFKTDHYNAKGRKVGSSYSGGFNTDHYNADGKRTGSSYRGSFFQIITIPKDTSAAVVIKDFSEVQNLLSMMNK